MTDLEMTRLCAEAMGIGIENTIPGAGPWSDRYDPLHDDAQAMALLVRFELNIGWYKDHRAGCSFHEPPNWVMADTLNRAIVECVAKMQAAKMAA